MASLKTNEKGWPLERALNDCLAAPKSRGFELESSEVAGGADEVQEVWLSSCEDARLARNVLEEEPLALLLLWIVMLEWKALLLLLFKLASEDFLMGVLLFLH